MHSQERIIDLIALIRSLLKKWRRMLICAVVFALLFGAYAYMTRKQTTVDKAEAAEGEESAADAYAAELKIINDNLANKNRYIQNSKLLQLDPNAVSRAFVRFTVTMDPNAEDEEEKAEEGEAAETIVQEVAQSAQPAEQAEVKINAQGGETEEGATATQVIMDEDTRKSVSILRYYVNSVNYMSDFGDLPEKLGLDKEYIRELCWGTVENEAVISGSVQAIYSDEESARAILEQAITCMRNARSKATALYGKHRLTIEPVIVRTSVDRTYNTQMKERLQEMNDLKTQRDNFQKNFSVSAASSSKNEKHPFRKMFAKYVILGFFLGLFLYLFVRTARILMFGIVLSSEELKNMYGLDRISAVPYIGKVNFIDRLILMIGGDRFSSMNSDIAFEIACENISEKLSGINAAGSVALVTDLPEDRAQMVLDKVSEHTEGGVRVEIMPHLTHSPKELARLKSCDAAVIVAEGGFSKLHSVVDLIHTLDTYKKQVLGSIVIG